MKRRKGHPKLCQCAPCVARRFDAFVDSMESFERRYHTKPTNPAQTVAVRQFTVRAHFRRNPRHLNQDPALRARVAGYLLEETMEAARRATRRRGRPQGATLQ